MLNTVSDIQWVSLARTEWLACNMQATVQPKRKNVTKHELRPKFKQSTPVYISLVTEYCVCSGYTILYRQEMKQTVHQHTHVFGFIFKMVEGKNKKLTLCYFSFSDETSECSMNLGQSCSKISSWCGWIHEGEHEKRYWMCAAENVRKWLIS